jgi:putative membrane protein
MLRRHFIPAALLCVAVAAVGCEQTISGLGGKPSPILPIGESHFIKVLANANQQEVEMSRIALKRSHNDQVRQYAQQMIDDHTQAQEQLSQLAQSKGAELPKVLGNMEQGMVNDLSAQSDSNFDKAYIDGQVTSHQDAINNTNAEAMNGSDVDVKAFAQKVLPTLQHHLVMAKTLQQGGRVNLPNNGNTNMDTNSNLNLNSNGSNLNTNTNTNP